MRGFFEDLKSKAAILVIIALVASVVLGGSLTKSITDAKASGADSIIYEVFKTWMGNITDLSPLTFFIILTTNSPSFKISF